MVFSIRINDLFVFLAGRKVKEKELRNPVKKVKARKKQSSKGFQLLDSYVDSNEKSFPTKYCDDEEEMDSLYGIWQTKKWAPPAVGPSDEIPVNEYKNVELALINPGKLVDNTSTGLRLFMLTTPCFT